MRENERLAISEPVTALTEAGQGGMIPGCLSRLHVAIAARWRGPFVSSLLPYVLLLVRASPPSKAVG